MGSVFHHFYTKIGIILFALSFSNLNFLLKICSMNLEGRMKDLSTTHSFIYLKFEALFVLINSTILVILLRVLIYT